jgi:starch synthase (maltosyl-transferring)
MTQKKETAEWKEVSLTPLVNDRWYGSFTTDELGCYRYTLCAWIDVFGTWRTAMWKKAKANQAMEIELKMGIGMIESAVGRASQMDGQMLQEHINSISAAETTNQKIQLLLNSGLYRMMKKYPDKKSATYYDKILEIIVDRPKALFSAWYEMFPRSCSPTSGDHGTFQDCEKRLPYIAEMGFDVLYLPPIHPIGYVNRKGRNNTPDALPEDPGSPWAIGSSDGGHKSVHPQLGTLEDFRHLIKTAGDYGLEVAMDIAYQCAPDHPYVDMHPEWFKHRPDGSIQYAENPPKKYEDIYPLDFECDHWQELVLELKEVLYFWMDQGIRIFRVDNPHTKPLAFWHWLIQTAQADYPDVIFLAEAFTRPKIMYRLAKLGFNQSYTYFAWRNTSQDIETYFRELTRTAVREFFRPNLWPNTPDILAEYLQTGGRPGFIIRLVLAATLGASYGIYGPAFELCANQPKEMGSEEYQDSEKYEIKHWDIENPANIHLLIGRINQIRHENAALQNNRSLQFHSIDNDQMICYTKHTADRSNIILTVVNLDPHHTHAGWLTLPLLEMKLDSEESYQMHDLLSDSRYLWQGNRNYLELNPQVIPAHIFSIRRKVRTEQDFDYYF